MVEVDDVLEVEDGVVEVEVEVELMVEVEAGELREEDGCRRSVYMRRL